MARREKKPAHKVVMTEGKRNIIQQLLQEYDIETAEDIQDALKDLLGGTIKEMMEAEMDDHLGYQKSENRAVYQSFLYGLPLLVCQAFAHHHLLWESQLVLLETECTFHDKCGRLSLVDVPLDMEEPLQRSCHQFLALPCLP